MPEDIALFIDFENIRYSMLNIQRREPDPQELIAVARRYGTVMVARAYADWSRQPEPFKGSLTAAMIDRVDCPAKQRDRIRMSTHYGPGQTPTGALPAPGYSAEQNTGSFPASTYGRSWNSPSNSGPLPSIQHPQGDNGWSSYHESSESDEPDEQYVPPAELPTESSFEPADYDQQPARPNYYQYPYGHTPSGPLSQNSTGPLSYQHSGNTSQLPAVGNGQNTIVQSTIVQSTVDLNMLMDIIETVFDRPTISTFVLMTGDKDFTRICARLKLRLNKTVIVVGIPGTVSRDLVSSANQFVPLVPGGGPPVSIPSSPVGGSYIPSGTTGSMPAVSFGSPNTGYPPGAPPIEVLDPQFLQFLDYIDRNWSWRTVIGVSNFIGDPLNPKNRFRGRLTRESARELLNSCIQQNILLVQTDASGAEDLRLNRSHPGVDEILKQIVR